jgi:hypothetical protein
LSLYISDTSSLSEDEVATIHAHLYRIANKSEKLTLFVTGPGGSGIAAKRIASLIRDYYSSVEVLVPARASSACTMLSLVGDVIYMSAMSSLSPIDTSIANHQLAPKGNDGYPVRVEITQIQKYLELMSEGMVVGNNSDITKTPQAILSQHVHPLVLGTIQRSLYLSKMLTRDILKGHINDDERISKIVDSLNDNFPTHSYPVDHKTALEIGINALSMPKQIDADVSKLLRYYSHISLEVNSEKDGIQVRTERPIIIESQNLRSHYAVSRSYILDEKKTWTRQSFKDAYIHYIPVQESGITKIKSKSIAELFE